MFRSYPKKKQLNLGGKVVKIVKSKRKRKPTEQKTYSELVKIADTLFAKAIKKKYCVDGVIQCYTCSALMTWSEEKGNKNCHLSHFQSRRSHKIRWHEDNARPACYNCNVWNSGRIEVFEEKLIREIGREKVNELKAIAVAPNIHDREFVLNIIVSLRGRG